jgi:hypothetical protein
VRHPVEVSVWYLKNVIWKEVLKLFTILFCGILATECKHILTVWRMWDHRCVAEIVVTNVLKSGECGWEICWIYSQLSLGRASILHTTHPKLWLRNYSCSVMFQKSLFRNSLQRPVIQSERLLARFGEVNYDGPCFSMPSVNKVVINLNFVWCKISSNELLVR